MNKISLWIAVVACTLSAYLLYLSAHQQKTLDQTAYELAVMEAHAQMLEQQILELQLANAQLKEQSLEGLLGKGNRVVQEKWDGVAEYLLNELSELGERQSEDTQGEGAREQSPAHPLKKSL